MESWPYAPCPRFCDVCGFCVRADAFDDHVRGKKHRRKIKDKEGPVTPSLTSDAYYQANRVANAELFQIYVRCAKRLERLGPP
eukprot:11182153-Lingulodinium_polyedra.AAC.1